MTLWLSMAAIVTIMIFVVLREYLPAMIRFELKSEQTGKIKPCGHVVQPRDVPISDRRSRERTKKVSDYMMPLTRSGLRSDNSLPKHKRDPRVFVDSEEIGDEPFS